MAAIRTVPAAFLSIGHCIARGGCVYESRIVEARLLSGGGIGRAEAPRGAALRQRGSGQPQRQPPPAARDGREAGDETEGEQARVVGRRAAELLREGLKAPPAQARLQAVRQRPGPGDEAGAVGLTRTT